VCEHCSNRDIGKAKDIIIESGKVDTVNSSKDLFFDLFLNNCGSGKFLEGGIIEVCSFGMGSSIGTSCRLGCRAQVCRAQVCRE